MGLGALLSGVLDKLPEGNAGLAIKLAVAVVGAIWWTSAPGADEARWVARAGRTGGQSGRACTDSVRPSCAASLQPITALLHWVSRARIGLPGR